MIWLALYASLYVPFGVWCELNVNCRLRNHYELGMSTQYSSAERIYSHSNFLAVRSEIYGSDSILTPLICSSSYACLILLSFPRCLMPPWSCPPASLTCPHRRRPRCRRGPPRGVARRRAGRGLAPPNQGKLPLKNQILMKFKLQYCPPPHTHTHMRKLKFLATPCPPTFLCHHPC